MSVDELSELQKEVEVLKADRQFAWKNNRILEEARQSEMAKRDAAEKECEKLRAENEALRQSRDDWHKVADERSAEIVRLRASYTSLLQWLQGQGLLVRHAMCTKPDNTFGPAWVLRGVAAVQGDSCLGWHESDPVAAVEAAVGRVV